MLSRTDYQLDKKDIGQIETIVKGFFTPEEFNRLSEMINNLQNIAKELFTKLTIASHAEDDDLASLKSYIEKLTTLVQRIQSIADFYDLLMVFAKENSQKKVELLIDQNKYGLMKIELNALVVKTNFFKGMLKTIDAARVAAKKSSQVIKSTTEQSTPSQDTSTIIVSENLTPLTEFDTDITKLKKRVYTHIEILIAKHIIVHACNKMKNLDLMDVTSPPNTLKKLQSLREHYEEWYKTNDEFIQYTSSLFALIKDISAWLINLSRGDKEFLKSIFNIGTFRKDYNKLKFVLPGDVACDKNIELVSLVVNHSAVLERLEKQSAEIIKRNQDTIMEAEVQIQLSDELKAWITKSSSSLLVEKDLRTDEHITRAIEVYNEGDDLRKRIDKFDPLTIDGIIRKLELAKVDAGDELPKVEELLKKLTTLKLEKDFDSKKRVFYEARKQLRIAYHITGGSKPALDRMHSLSSLKTKKAMISPLKLKETIEGESVKETKDAESISGKTTPTKEKETQTTPTIEFFSRTFEREKSNDSKDETSQSTDKKPTTPI